MSKQEITKFSTELVASVCDLLEATNANPKVVASVRSLIYSKRDSFILMNLESMEARPYDKSR
jgi:hypothetical protein